MDALAAAHDAAVQMIDTSIIRVHQHGACIANNSGQHIGRSRGGLTSKIHVVVDANGLPVQLGLTGGQVHDNQLCSVLLRQMPRRGRLLADRGYDADWIRAFVTERGAWANIPPKRNRKDPICFSPYLYRDRNLHGALQRAWIAPVDPWPMVSWLLRRAGRAPRRESGQIGEQLTRARP